MVRLHNARALNRLENATVVFDNPRIQKVFDLLSLAVIFRIAKTLGKAGKASMPGAETEPNETLLSSPGFKGLHRGGIYETLLPNLKRDLSSGR